MMTRYCRFIPILLIMAALLASGCARDFLGFEELVTSSSHLQKNNVIEDDKIEDKNPEYIEGLEVDEFFEPCTVRMNKTGSVVELSLPELEEDEKELETALYRGRAEAIAELEDYTRAELIPSLESVFGTTKPINDGLYAAIEWNMQYGIDEVWKGKQAFLVALQQALADARDNCTGQGCEHLAQARAFVLAGAELGGADITIPAELEESVSDMLEAFLANPMYARPIGFYSWQDGLGDIFRQDRFFQNAGAEMTPFSDGQVGQFAAIAYVLGQDDELRADYEYILGLYERLTNPYAHYSPLGFIPFVTTINDLADIDSIRAAFLEAQNEAVSSCGPHLALFPSSKSKEVQMYEEMFCNASPPADVTIIDIFIDQSRTGKVSLDPDSDSGWYDYQTWALETLLVPEKGPESDHLMLTAAYKKKLIDTFKSILTQNRETHVKQLDIAVGMGSAAPMEEYFIDLYPNFVSEPFPTFYLRTARAYRFLLAALQERLGAGFLAATGRFRDSGEQDEVALDETIRETARLLYGLYLMNCDSLGMKRELLEEELVEFPEADCILVAQDWLSGWTTNPDVLSDPRVIVPVAMDLATGKAIYWVIVGVRVLKAKAEFHKDHQPEVISLTGPEGSTCHVDDIVPGHYYLLTEKQVEVRISMAANPPTRDELRALCDEHKTETAIVEALENWN